MASQSEEAISAYQEYFRREQNTCRAHPFVMNFIYFFTDRLDLDLDFDLFPSEANREIPDEEALRIRTLREITDAFLEDYEDTTGKFDLSEELRTDEHAYSVLVEVFYFCLNRRQRQPSDKDRDPGTKTANELRREIWWAQIREKHAKAQRSIQEMIRRISHAQTGRSHDAERSQSRLDDHPEPGTKHATEDSEVHIDRITDTEADTETNTTINTETNTATNTEIEDGDIAQPASQLQGEQALSAPGFETEAMLPHSLELDPVNREEVFDYIVVKTKERHGNRYGWFFETDVGKTVGKSLEEYLTPAVRDICESGSFTLERSVVTRHLIARA
jgi:hypothetical protein